MARSVAFHYLAESRLTHARLPIRGSRAITYLFDRNMGEIDGHTECPFTIIEGELVHERTQAELEAECLC